MRNKTAKQPGNISRRNFIRSTSAAAVAMLGAPMIIPSRVLGANAPSNRINIAIIGCGNQSSVDVPEFLKYDQCRVVAVCDVNRASHGYKDEKQFLGREPLRDMVNKAYAQDTQSGTYKGCDMYTDFREILARKDVDAVEILTPDHWHAVMTIMAAEAGKDIYCQKPLTLTIHDGQEMIKAVRKHNRILQTGSQWRSHKMMRHACELILNGRVGKLQRIESFVAPNNFFGPGPGWKPMPVPEGFDYDSWLGPAPKAEYHKDRCLYRFRFIFDYSGGQTTNFGCHSNGLIQWALGDGNIPVEYEDMGSEFPPKGDLYNTPTKVAFRARYASGAEIECKTDKRSFGLRFEGSEGWLEVSSKKLESNPVSIKDSVIGDNEKHLYVSENHYRNFIDCVKSRKEPVEPVECGHRTAALCHLGNIAMILKRKIKFDPVKEEILGDSEAAGMLARPLRAPWHY